MVKVQFLHSQLRVEEKLLLKEFRNQNIDVIKTDIRTQKYNLTNIDSLDIDIAFERSISYSQGLNAIRILEAYGVNCINNSDILQICGDKIVTTLKLSKYKVRQPLTQVAYSQASAIEILEKHGYPMVIKPIIGSWGRLLAKINDRDSAEAILEHKSKLGYMNSIFYLQEYIEKNGRDIRSFVVGDQCIAAIFRKSEHWITNTSRGGIAENCAVDDEIFEISINAARAVTNGNLDGIVAIDIFEDENGYMINEVNGTMEFKNSISTTGVDIPNHMVNFIVSEGRK